MKSGSKKSNIQNIPWKIGSPLIDDGCWYSSFSVDSQGCPKVEQGRLRLDPVETWEKNSWNRWWVAYDPPATYHRLREPGNSIDSESSPSPSKLFFVFCVLLVVLKTLFWSDLLRTNCFRVVYVLRGALRGMSTSLGKRLRSYQVKKTKC